MNGKMNQSSTEQEKRFPISGTDARIIVMTVTFWAVAGYMLYSAASTDQLNAMLVVAMAYIVVIPGIFLARVAKRLIDYRSLSKDGEELEAKVVNYECVPGLSINRRLVWNLKVAYLDSRNESNWAVLELGDLRARINYPIGSTVKMLTDGERFALASKAYSKRLPGEDKLVPLMQSQRASSFQHDQFQYGF